MAIVSGYVNRPESRAALDRAIAESRVGNAKRHIIRTMVEPSPSADSSAAQNWPTAAQRAGDGDQALVDSQTQRSVHSGLRARRSSKSRSAAPTLLPNGHLTPRNRTIPRCSRSDSGAARWWEISCAIASRESFCSRLTAPSYRSRPLTKHDPATFLNVSTGSRWVPVNSGPTHPVDHHLEGAWLEN